jgi:hypothetical protein
MPAHLWITTSRLTLIFEKDGKNIVQNTALLKNAATIRRMLLFFRSTRPTGESFWRRWVLGAAGHPGEGSSTYTVALCPRSQVSVLGILPQFVSMTAIDTTAEPDLSIQLAHPITGTRVGPWSHLVTLMDAAILIRDLEPFRSSGLGPGSRDDSARRDDWEARRRGPSEPSAAPLRSSTRARAKELTFGTAAAWPMVADAQQGPDPSVIEWGLLIRSRLLPTRSSN